MDRPAVAVATMGLLLHLGMVLMRGLDSGHIPIVTRYENFTVDALFMAGTYVLAQWRWPQLRPTGIFVLLFAAFGVVAALTYSRGVFPMSPALRTNWLVIRAFRFLEPLLRKNRLAPRPLEEFLKLPGGRFLSFSMRF